MFRQFSGCNGYLAIRKNIHSICMMCGRRSQQAETLDERSGSKMVLRQQEKQRVEEAQTKIKNKI